MLALFRPAIKLLSRFTPWGRSSILIGMFLAAMVIAMASSPDRNELRVIVAWAMFLGSAYVLASFLIWSELSMLSISRIVERISLGDLSIREENHSGDDSDIHGVRTSIYGMSQNLAGIVRQVNASSQAIATASREIADGYMSLSRRTEAQAATLEETASGTEELTATVQQNAMGCGRASSLAEEASNMASQVVRSMESITETMQRIQLGSKRVSDISGLIQGIAFQTNILALNAAVEAARAGEHGRGFAIVSGEVRSLARRCADAAKEIKSIIGDSSSAVIEGAKVVSDATATTRQAVGKVHTLSQVVSEIAQASAEQSMGIAEIAKAIQQLEGVTQQNAALVEQTGAAADSFQEESLRLLDAVSAFKLDRSGARESAMSLVRKAVAHLEKVGVQAAFEDFTHAQGQFVSGEYYVLVYGLSGVLRCDGSGRGSIGRDNSEIKDARGKQFIREILHTASTRGKGWVDYHWHNPGSGRIEPKSTYFERSGDLVVLCGIYRHEGAVALSPQAQRSPQRLIAQF